MRAAQPGLLQRSDRFYLELCCRLVARMRAGAVKSSEMNSVANVRSKLAMNPTDRAKLNLEPPAKPKEKSPWDALDELDQAHAKRAGTLQLVPAAFKFLIWS